MAEISETETAQLEQTIEMFEVITQSQPTDYQSLEILKEAYFKLSREDKVIDTSKRIANAYVQLGQLSSAILEYESILQRYPDDADVQKALADIEIQATGFSEDVAPLEPDPTPEPIVSSASPTDAAKRQIDDGRSQMRKIFVDGKKISEGDFDKYWKTPDILTPPFEVSTPFLQTAADTGGLNLNELILTVADRSRCAYIPISSYDIDLDLSSSFDRDTCMRWCVLPFDRLSKTIFVATANPFNKQAITELERSTPNRLICYMANPADLKHQISKALK